VPVVGTIPLPTSATLPPVVGELAPGAAAATDEVVDAVAEVLSGLLSAPR
jgi:hypothetical protein